MSKFSLFRTIFFNDRAITHVLFEVHRRTLKQHPHQLVRIPSHGVCPDYVTHVSMCNVLLASHSLPLNAFELVAVFVRHEQTATPRRLFTTQTYTLIQFV